MLLLACKYCTETVRLKTCRMVIILVPTTTVATTADHFLRIMVQKLVAASTIAGKKGGLPRDYAALIVPELGVGRAVAFVAAVSVHAHPKVLASRESA